jgi:hypothetical protein
MAKKSKKSKTPETPKSADVKPAAAAPKTAAAPVAAPAAAPTTAAISARAHQIWIARGKPTPGTPLADWVQAERELGVRKS